MHEGIYADIILLLSISNALTYEIPSSLAGEVSVVKRALVHLGKQKDYSGIVRKIHSHAPENDEVKDIQSVLDEQPVVNEKQIELWEWIASYYRCTIGEVMNGGLPLALKLHSETTVVRNPAYEHDHEQLSD